MSLKDLRVVIADSNPIFRTGVCAILREQGGIARVEELTGFQEVRDLLSSNRTLPNVILLGFAADAPKALELITELSELHANIRIIGLSTLSEDVCAARVLRAGGAGYLPANCDSDELVSAIRTVSQGRLYLTTKASATVLSQLHSGSHDLHSRLSAREYQILTMICRGVALVRIGEEFGISVKTVSTYRARILKKMKMQTNAELIQYAIRYGVIEPVAS